MMKKIGSGLLFLLPLVFLLSVFFTNFNTPFRTVDEDNGYLFGGVARSHLFLGLGKTFGQDFFYEGQGKEPIPYVHHPPGVGLSLALILRLLNFGDLDRPFWQERLLPTFYHVGTYLLIFFLSRHFFQSLKAAFISCVIFVLMPMSLYYGRMVSHEPPTLFFLLLTTYLFRSSRISPGSVLADGANKKQSRGQTKPPASALGDALYLKFRSEGRKIVKIGFFVSLFFSCLYGWPGFYFIPVVLVLEFFDFGKRKFKIDGFFWQLVFCEAFLLLVFFGQIFIANKFSFRPTIELIQEKNALPYEDGFPYFKIPWLSLLGRRFLGFFTPIVALPAGIYLVYLTFRRLFKGKAEKLSSWQRMSLIFFFISLIHVFTWRLGSNLPYWQIYFLPALVFCATYLFLFFENLLKKVVGSKVWSWAVTFLYYGLIFYILIRQSQPLVWDLYTKGGIFSFPHFYINGF